MDEVQSKSQTSASSQSESKTEAGDKGQTSKEASRFSEASSRSTPKAETASVMQSTVSAVRGSDDDKKSSGSKKSSDSDKTDDAVENKQSDDSDKPAVEERSTDSKNAGAKNTNGEGRSPSPKNAADDDQQSFVSLSAKNTEKSTVFDSWFSNEKVISFEGTGVFAIDDIDDVAAKEKQPVAVEVERKVNSSLLKAAEISGEDINNLIEENGGIFTTNADGEIALKPVIVKDTVQIDKDAILGEDVLQRMQARIQLNDRANAYLELYNATGEEQLVLQAQITTYTGAIGSMALVGNMLAKDANPEKYNLSLDQFSLDILQGTHDLARQFVGKPVYNLDRNRLQDADHAVWASKGMGEHFPGNIQFVDYSNHKNPELAKQIFNSQGTTNSLQMGQEFNMPGSTIRHIGNRPAEFLKDGDKYNQIDGERFISVVEKNTGKIVAFWDKDLPLVEEENPTKLPILFSQIPNTTRSEKGHFEWHGNSGTFLDPWDFLSGTAIREYLEADNPQIPVGVTIENKDVFADQHPVKSRVLDIIRNEIRDEDFVLWMRKQ